MAMNYNNLYTFYEELEKLNFSKFQWMIEIKMLIDII